MNVDRLAKTLSGLIKNGDKRKTSGYDTTAKVVRVEDSIAWVHIPGGVDETPVKLSINATNGDTVRVRVSGGDAWIVGNDNAPPTDDTTAVQAGVIAGHAANVASSALDSAEVAHQAAQSAQSSAAQAQKSADEARVSATNANEYASRALTGLSTVQSVAETLTWITQHGTMTLTTDTQIDPTHVYFVLDPNGDYVVGNTHYSLVTEPDPDDLSTYYELSIDESLNNYVGTHLAVTEDGLWLLPAGHGTYKILIATGAGSTYTTAGTYIIDSTGGTIASFRVDGVTIGDILSGNTRIEITSGGMQVYRKTSSGDQLIANIGYGESKNISGNSNSPYYTFGSREKAISDYSSSNFYLPGELVRYNNKDWVCVDPIGVQGHAPSSSSEYWSLTIGAFSFAAGIGNVSSHSASFAEGFGKALNIAAHAEGDSTALGEYSHAQNRSTWAEGDYSHAQGVETEAKHEGSSASGHGTRTSADYQTVLGQYNKDDSDALLIIGNGANNSDRSNAFVVKKNGILYAYGNASTEASVRAEQGSGVIYTYAQVATNGNKGIYGYNSSNQGKEVLRLNSNNEVSLYGSATSVSDLKKKDIIDDFDWKAEDFIRGLKPIAYRMKYQDGTKGKRIHMGFGAQDVKALSDELHMGDLSVYKAHLLQKDEEGRMLEVDYDGHEVADEKLSWGLDYAELIPMLTKEIQRLMTRVDELERRLDGEGKK